MKIAIDAGHGLKTPGKQTPDGIKEWLLNDKVRDKVVYYLREYDVGFVFLDNDEGNVDESLASRVKKYINAGVVVVVSIHHNALRGVWNDATGVEVFVDRNYTEEDMKLAKAIYENLPNYTGLKGRGIKKENWYVINQNKVPAVLTEGGFMDSRIDYPVITSEKGQDAYARAIAEGLIKYLNLKKKTVTTQANQTTTQANAPSSSANYLVKINTDELNVRKDAGTSFEVTAKVKRNEVYTIVEEKMNGATKWGKLKSGAGWNSLAYTVKVNRTTTAQYYPACNSNQYSLVNALNLIGVDSSFDNRKKIAIANGVRNYTGTALQNNQLLTKLKAGKLRK